VIAVDTCAFSNFLRSVNTSGARLFEEGLREGDIVLPPMVLTELISAKNLSDDDKALVKAIPVITLDESFWLYAGMLRLAAMKRGSKPRTLDTLIAACCLQANTPLITDDSDFRVFKHFGLKLL